MAEITEFNIGQGETFKILTSLENIDTGQVRENFTTDEVAATFTITKLTPQTSGSFYVELTPADTSALTQRKYVYDVKMTSGSITRRVLEGYFVVRPAATR